MVAAFTISGDGGWTIKNVVILSYKLKASLSYMRRYFKNSE